MAIELDQVYAEYGHPDPATVSILSKNDVDLSYVGHAEITKALSEIDPEWTWEPVLGADGLPAIRIQHGKIPRRDKDPLLVEMATMWGRLTLRGVTRWAVGSVEAHKPDLDKELVSDFLRNAAMRFGVALSLWMKDSTAGSSKPRMTSKPHDAHPNVTVTEPQGMPTEKQRNYARSLLKAGGFPEPPNFMTMSRWLFSDLIEQLKNGTYTPPVNNDDAEEPF